jgi:8-oxo-dGTP diphosphatase
MFPFNIRVYGILINDRGEVLLSDEFRNGFSFTKFPGGGLEFGEGFREALKREFLEELNLEIEVGDVFYFNEFHQPSAFDPRHQVHSFYYLVRAENWRSITAGEHSLPLREDGEKHRWIQLGKLSDALFTFPIDKLVAEKLRQKD